MRHLEHFKILIGLTAAILLAACQSDFCHVKGTVSGLADGDTLYLNDLLSTLTTDQSPHTSIIVVQNGGFIWETEVDTARLYRLWPAHDPQHSVTFFAERGTVCIDIQQSPFTAHVSGTRLNEEWQSLNDMAASYSQRISRTISCLVSAGTPPSLIHQRVSKLYQEMEQIISETAERNKDNELGRFISSHHEQ